MDKTLVLAGNYEQFKNWCREQQLPWFSIGFVIGMFIGANVGVVLLALMIAGRRGEIRRDG